LGYLEFAFGDLLCNPVINFLVACLVEDILLDEVDERIEVEFFAKLLVNDFELEALFKAMGNDLHVFQKGLFALVPRPWQLSVLFNVLIAY